jgi:hypothetical protein
MIQTTLDVQHGEPPKKKMTIEPNKESSDSVTLLIETFNLVSDSGSD